MEQLASSRGRALTVVGICVALVVPIFYFLHEHVLPFVLDWSADTFGSWWDKRGSLALHMFAGTVAVLAGPMQLWTGLRRSQPRIHRWIGRGYVVGSLISAGFSMRLAVTTDVGWTWGLSCFVLASWWIACLAVAVTAIRRGDVQLHVQWMLRAYAATFAFVTYRILNELGPTSFRYHEPGLDLFVTNVWLSWILPLAILEIAFAVRRLRRHG